MSKGQKLTMYETPSVQKNEILPFAATWMYLEGIRLSVLSQTKTNTVWYHLYVESKNIQQPSEYNKKEADSQV